MIALQVVPSYYPASVYGGPIFSIHYTAQALAAIGIDIRVATTNANGAGRLDVPTDRPVLLAPGYAVHYYQDTIINRFSLAFSLGLPGDIRRCDVVHLQDVFSLHAVWALVWAALWRKPLLLSARGVLTRWGLSGKRPLAKKLWLRVLVLPLMANRNRCCWHATAEEERAEILAVAPQAEVAVIPNGLDLASFATPADRDRARYLAHFAPGLRAPAQARIVAALGRLHAKKAFDVAIEAVALMHPDTILLIAGADDGERSGLEALARRLGLEKRVAFIGEVVGPDKVRFLQGADAFAFPSHNENFGMVALEALAAGLPVVASLNTPWAGIAEEGAGFHVANDAPAFAKALDAVFESGGHRPGSPMRLAANHLAARYDLPAVAQAFAKTYGELIDASNG